MQVFNLQPVIKIIIKYSYYIVKIVKKQKINLNNEKNNNNIKCNINRNKKQNIKFYIFFYLVFIDIFSHNIIINNFDFFNINII
jgi:hypothetical protein